MHSHVTSEHTTFIHHGFLQVGSAGPVRGFHATRVFLALLPETVELFEHRKNNARRVAQVRVIETSIRGVASSIVVTC